jgi:hypothetical protein
MTGAPHPSPPAARPAARPTPVYRGRIDRIDGQVIEGWALVGDGRVPAELEILYDGALLGTAVADRPRPDLKEKGIGTGRHGFLFPVPGDVTLDDGTLAGGGGHLTVLFRNTGVPLRPPTDAGQNRDPVAARLDEVSVTLGTLGQMIRHQQTAGDRGATQNAETQREILATVDRLERLLSIGFARTLRARVSRQTAGLVASAQRLQFRTMKIMGLLIVSLLAAIGLGLAVLLSR